MLNKILMVLLFSFASQVALAGSSARQFPGAFIPTAEGKNVNYLLYTPPAFDNEPNRKFPLIVFLHGMDEKPGSETPMVQSDLAKLIKNGIPKMIAEDRWPDSQPFIVLSTQCHLWCGSQNPHNIMQAINLIADKYRVDRSQIYITGLSMGASDVNNFVNTYPDVPAAAVPIAGWGAPNCSFPNVGWWGLTNEFDDRVGKGGTTSFGDILNACKNRGGVQTRTTVYYGSYGHDSWTKTYDLSAGQDIYAFMLAHRRGTPPNPDPTNVAPKISEIAPIEIQLPNNRIVINAQASDADGYIASTLIENLSGGTAHIQDPGNLYTSIYDLTEGNYEFKITVKDNLGATASTIVKVRVNAQTPPENPPGTDHYAQVVLAQAWNGMTIWGGRPWGPAVNLKSLGHTHFKLVVRRKANVAQAADLKIRTGGGEHYLNFAKETANGEFKELLLPLTSMNGDFSKFSHVYMSVGGYSEINLDIAFMGFVGGSKDFVLISKDYSNIQSAMSPPIITIK